MRNGIIYECKNANCRTPIYTGRCSKECIKRYNKEMGIKPQTHGDRIRAMSDRELARFMAERNVNESTVQLINKENALTAVQIEALRHRIYCAYMQWLKQPAEDMEKGGQL